MIYHIPVKVKITLFVMYRVVVDRTSEVLHLDLDDLLGELRPFTTYQADDGEYYNKKDDFMSWIKEKSFDLKMVYDVYPSHKVLVSNVYYASDIIIINPNGNFVFTNEVLEDDDFFQLCLEQENVSIHSMRFKINNRKRIDILLESEYWDGRTSYIDISFMSDIEVITKIIKSKRWKGYCAIFHPDILRDVDICTKIISSPRWNGYAYPFKNITSRKFWIKVINKRNWKWDYIPRTIPNFEDMCYRMLNSKYWSNYVNLFDKKSRNNLDLCLKVATHERWDGSIKHFGGRLRNDPSFCCTIAQLEKWNKNFEDFGSSAFKSVRLTTLYIKKANIVSPKVISSCLGNKNVFKQMIKSGKWNGSCFDIKAEHFTDKDNFDLIINCPQWNGSVFMDIYFLKENIEYAEKMLRSPYIFKSDVPFLKNIIKSCKEP